MIIVDLEEFRRLARNAEWAVAQEVPGVEEDPGLEALATFEVPSAEHFQCLSRIFHFHCGNNAALHQHFDNLDFRVDLARTITCKKIELAVRTLGLTVVSDARGNKLKMTNYLVSRLQDLIHNLQQIAAGNLALTAIHLN